MRIVNSWCVELYRLPNLFVAFPLKEKHITAAFRFNFLVLFFRSVIGCWLAALAAVVVVVVIIVVRNVFGRHSSDVSMFDMV